MTQLALGVQPIVNVVSVLPTAIAVPLECAPGDAVWVANHVL